MIIVMRIGRLDGQVVNYKPNILLDTKPRAGFTDHDVADKLLKKKLIRIRKSKDRQNNDQGNQNKQ